MVVIAYLLGFLSLLSGLFLVLKGGLGVKGALLWFPKLGSGAWAQVWILFGLAALVLGILSQAWVGAAAGLIGALLELRFIFQVTRPPREQFSSAFGAGWLERIPPELMKRLASRRFRLVQPAPPVVPGARDVDLGPSGGTQERLLCDLWFPPPDVPRTGLALLYLHGGAWQALDKDFLTAPLFRRLAAQGHLIMDVAYSLSPGAQLDRMLGDVKQAIAWLKAHAGEYRVDPDRIVLMGVSGGAHLAMLAAYAPGHPAFQPVCPGADMSVRGVVSMFGITDLAAFHEEYGRTNPKQPATRAQIDDHLRPVVHDRTGLERFMTRARLFPAYRHANMPGGPLLMFYLMGGTLKEIPEAYRLASPLVYAGPHCPPTLLMAAEDDFVVDPSHSLRLHAALKQAGVPSVCLVFPGCVHGFDQYFGVSRRVAPAAQSATYDLERFLALMC